MIQYLKEYYPGQKVYLVGTPDLEANFLENWIHLTKEMPDVVVFGFDMTLTYEKLERACTYIRNGAVDFDKNSVLEGTVNGDTAWWNVRGGQVIFRSSVADNEMGWWRIENGKVNFGYNGIAQNDFGWWYIRNGQVDFSYTGTVTDSNRTYQVVNGNVNRQ